MPARISNLKGAIPTTYDAGWKIYTDLNAQQILAFQAFPEDLRRYASQRRWVKEISQLTLPNGMVVSMDDVPQRKLAGLKQAFDNGTLTGSVKFVLSGSTFTLQAADVTAIYEAAVQRVQGSYSALADLLDGIKAGNVTSRAQIDAAFASVQ